MYSSAVPAPGKMRVSSSAIFPRWKAFMLSFRAIVSSGLSATLMFLGLAANAQTTADIQKTFGSKYALTKPTASRDDIVTAGDVIVLQKDGLVMVGVTASSPADNLYKNGIITPNFVSTHKGGMFNAVSSHFGGPSVANTGATRKFVSGEKFWITGVDVKEDGVVISVFSDAINDVRYYGTLKIPFNKGQAPPAADLAVLADQVFKVQPGDNGGGNGSGPTPAAAPAAAAAPASPPPAPLAPIAPPPPPADAAAVPPPTLKIGQTKDQVTAMLGQPTKVVKLATKEIDYYPDMKVTFVHDKVTNIE